MSKIIIKCGEAKQGSRENEWYIFSTMAGRSHLGICFQNPIELTRTKVFASSTRH